MHDQAPFRDIYDATRLTTAITVVPEHLLGPGNQAPGVSDSERGRAPRHSAQLFLDGGDKVQKKYEMLRLHLLDGQSVTVAARTFGFSRETFYRALRAFRRSGVLGLVDGKRGRRGPLKLTTAAIEEARALARQNPRLSAEAIARLLASDQGVRVHRRTVERLIAGRKDGPAARSGCHPLPQTGGAAQAASN